MAGSQTKIIIKPLILESLFRVKTHREFRKKFLSGIQELEKCIEVFESLTVMNFVLEYEGKSWFDIAFLKSICPNLNFDILEKKITKKSLKVQSLSLFSGSLPRGSEVVWFLVGNPPREVPDEFLQWIGFDIKKVQFILNQKKNISAWTLIHDDDVLKKEIQKYLEKRGVFSNKKNHRAFLDVKNYQKTEDLRKSLTHQTGVHSVSLHYDEVQSLNIDAVFLSFENLKNENFWFFFKKVHEGFLSLLKIIPNLFEKKIVIQVHGDPLDSARFKLLMLFVEEWRSLTRVNMSFYCNENENKKAA